MKEQTTETRNVKEVVKSNKKQPQMIEAQSPTVGTEWNKDKKTLVEQQVQEKSENEKTNNEEEWKTARRKANKRTNYVTIVGATTTDSVNQIKKHRRAAKSDAYSKGVFERQNKIH